MRNAKLVNKAFNSFLLASVLTVLGTQAGQLIDALMLSHFISPEAMAGVNITKPVAQILFAIASLFIQGGAMLAGMAIGNQDRKQANRLFSTTIIAIAVLGIVAMLFTVVGFDSLTDLLCSEDGNMREYTARYLNVLLLGAIPYTMMIALMQYVAVDGEPKLVTTATVASEISHVVLGYIFIYFFKWDVEGAAWSSNLSYIVACGILLLHFRKSDTLQFRIPSFSGKLLGKIFVMGIPIGISTALIAVRMTGSNDAAITFLGNQGMEVMAICNNLLGFSMIILSGTMSAFNPVATVLKGSDDNAGVLMVIKHAYRFMLISMAAYCAFLIFMPGTIANIFGVNAVSHAEAFNIAGVGIPIFALNIAAQSFVFILIPIYQIYGHKSLAMFISTAQPLLPMIMFRIMCQHDCGIAPWWGFFIGQMLVVAGLLPYVVYKWINDKTTSVFFLVPKKTADHIFDTTVSASIRELDSTMEELQNFLTNECGTNIADAVQTTLTVDELAQNSIKHGKASHVDIRVAATDGKIKFVLHDDGAPYNPTEPSKVTANIEDRIEGGLGLEVIQALAKDITYSYTFHQNVVSFTLTPNE